MTLQAHLQPLLAPILRWSVVGLVASCHDWFFCSPWHLDVNWRGNSIRNTFIDFFELFSFLFIYQHFITLANMSDIIFWKPCKPRTACAKRQTKFDLQTNNHLHLQFSQLESYTLSESPQTLPGDKPTDENCHHTQSLVGTRFIWYFSLLYLKVSFCPFLEPSSISCEPSPYIDFPWQPYSIWVCR